MIPHLDHYLHLQCTPLHASFWDRVSLRLFPCLLGVVLQISRSLQPVFPSLSVVSFEPVPEPSFLSPSPSPFLTSLS
jgi:hypothetical protein